MDTLPPVRPSRQRHADAELTKRKHPCISFSSASLLRSAKQIQGSFLPFDFAQGCQDDYGSRSFAKFLEHFQRFLTGVRALRGFS